VIAASFSLVMTDALLTVSVDKSRIVEEGNYHKFTKSKESKHFTKMLLDTGDRELVEVGIICCHKPFECLLIPCCRPRQRTASGA